MLANTLRWVFVAALACGCVKTDPTGSDAGPGAADAGPDPLVIQIQGTVELPYLSNATDVAIVAHCGPRKVDTTTDANGAYSLTIDTDGCSPLVVEYTKESYLPVVKRISMPLGKPSLTVDARLLELTELSCGSNHCSAEGYNFSRFPSGPMARGWVSTMGGPRSLEYFGGDLRDQNGDLMWATAFAFFDLRDIDGAPMEDIEPFEQCMRVDYDAVEWLVDADPSTDEVEQLTYTLAADRGRWTRRDSHGYVSYTANTEIDKDGYPYDVIERVDRSQLPDIVAGQFSQKLWLCGQIERSGWLAFGLTMPEKTCFRMTTRDSCQTALKNTSIQVQGRDYGFITAGWTDQAGSRCIEVARSEPQGENYDFDASNGETYFVDITAVSDIRYERIESQQVPRTPGSCAQPETCATLDIEFQTFQSCQ